MTTPTILVFSPVSPLLSIEEGSESDTGKLICVGARRGRLWCVEKKRTCYSCYYSWKNEAALPFHAGAHKGEKP